MLTLKIARSHHFLKQYHDAIAAYEKYGRTNSLSIPDLYYYAEAQSGILNYEKALESYQAYLGRVPDDQLIMKKIWRLNNLQFLYEDSLALRSQASSIQHRIRRTLCNSI